ncbi:copper chaperone PCu(A)C [Nocardia mikamii]|uniref:copper chaperone PCu(A)C n=1 Tax=Nocardia mikamii TaxID=508464 RepID=UPI000A01F200|nr:copper chaperone PCu(A)C [Nocardia mikamii]
MFCLPHARRSALAPGDRGSRRPASDARHRSAALLITATASIPLLLAGCSSGGTSTAADANSVTVSDQWIKAADAGMSAAFANFTNTSDHEIRVVDATSPASARMEIHEVVESNGTSMMRPKAGGLAIPAHGSAKLTPGGDHLMFIDLKAPLRTGAQTPVTVKFADGTSTTFTAQVRDFAGNQENYSPTPAAHGG